MSSIPAQKSFFDERYRDKTHQLKLFAELGEGYLLTTLFDDATKEYVAFEEYRFEGEPNWVSSQRKLEKILPMPYFQETKSRQLTISSSLYTLVPLALFDEKELQNYLEFNHPIAEPSNYKFHVNKIEAISAAIVFAIPRGLEFLTKAKLPPYQLQHIGTTLLENIGLQKKNQAQLNVHVQQGRFDVIYFPNERLEFFNSFQYQSTEDFIYYLLYVMEQLQLDREKVTIHLMGEIEKDSSIYQMLYTYIKTVTLAKRSSDTSFSAVLAELPEQYYFALFNQHLCA